MARLSLSYPDTGLSISISLYERDTGVLAFSGTMTEVEGVYKYDFTEVINTDYIYVANCTGYDTIRGVIYRDGGGLTTEQAEQLTRVDSRIDKKLSDVGGFGGFYQKSRGLDIEDKQYIKETHEKVLTLANTDISNIEKIIIDNQSQNGIYKTEILDTIKASENEICSDIVRKSKEIKDDNVKTRNLVRKKSEKAEKFATKQLDTMERIEKEIEDTENEIKEEFDRLEMEEKEISDMFDQYDKDEEEIRKEFDKIDSN